MQARFVIVFVLTMAVGAVWYYLAHRPRWDIPVRIIHADGAITERHFTDPKKAIDFALDFKR